VAPIPDVNQILVFTGAGLSAESGVPTFRGPGGFWRGYDPRLVASIDTLDENRALVFEFYNDRRTKLPTVAPNAAHRWLAALQTRLGPRLTLFTQNVDDLLERAGCRDVVHLHGSLLEAHCRACDRRWHVGYEALPVTLRCPDCGSERTKPGIVMFGEQAPLYAIMHEVFGGSRDDLILVIGTAGAVIPFEYVVGNRRSTRRSYTVLNNLDRDPGVAYERYFDETLFKPATAALPECTAIVDRWLAVHPHGGDKPAAN
jgi:NAD-dependent deacetylase